jgi:hypothetical protein
MTKKKYAVKAGLGAAFRQRNRSALNAQQPSGKLMNHVRDLFNVYQHIDWAKPNELNLTHSTATGKPLSGQGCRWDMHVLEAPGTGRERTYLVGKAEGDDPRQLADPRAGIAVPETELLPRLRLCRDILDHALVSETRGPVVRRPLQFEREDHPNLDTPCSAVVLSSERRRFLAYFQWHEGDPFAITGAAAEDALLMWELGAKGQATLAFPGGNPILFGESGTNGRGGVTR